jgi:hypothetical protein
MSRKIYLGLPYTGLEERSFKVANKVGARLMKEGHHVFSPISQSHPMSVQEGLPGEWEFWASFDETFIKWCDYLYAVKIGDWKTSVGLTEEIKLANKHGKEIVYLEEVDGDWVICKEEEPVI